MNFTLTPSLMRITRTTHFPAAKSAVEGAYQARVAERAARMEADGYRAVQMGKTLWFAIFRPENRETGTGWRNYLVDLTPYKENCDCESFAKGSCKHMEFVLLLLDRQKHFEEQAREAEEAEDGRLFLENLHLEW